jgi:hypothetical protein
MAHDDPIGRLARQVDASRKFEPSLISAEEVSRLRRQGACQLHQICAEFVSLLNSKLPRVPFELSPPAYVPEMFRDPDVNLMQVSAQGRQMQIVFQAPSGRFSTEKYAVPYILEGEIRSYNQQMLEHFEIRNQSLFYCLNNETAVWQFFDWKNPRAMPLNPNLLAAVMQQLF